MTRKRRMCIGILLLMASAAGSFAVGASCVREKSPSEIEKRLDRLESAVHSMRLEVLKMNDANPRLADWLDETNKAIDRLKAMEKTDASP